MPDILIKGGGMVGLLAAVALSQAGFEVCIEEKNSPIENDGLRVSSITPVTVKIFQSLGIWEEIEKRGVSPFEKIKVWEENPEKAIIFEGKKIGQFPLGYVVENRVIRQVLLNFLPSPGASRHPLPLCGRGDSEIKLIIAADGSESETRKAAGIMCDVKDYGQEALVAVIETQYEHQKIARQRFLPTGPLGILPLSNPHHCSIVWSHSNTIETEFTHLLQEALGNELGKLKIISECLTFPLKMQHAKQYVKPGLALIGDAAHTLHPLAGYGVNMGFLDAMALTQILKKALLEKRDISQLHTLRKYERARRSENLFMSKVIDSFTVDTLRKIGLSVTEKSQYLKNIFMQWMSFHGEENTLTNF